MNIKVMIALFALPGCIFASEKNNERSLITFTETTPLFSDTHTQILRAENHNELITQYIRTRNTTKLGELLTHNPTIAIPEELMDFARSKQEKSRNNCCRNLAPLLSSGVGAILSVYIALQPFSSRPIASGFRFVADFGLLTTAAGMTTHSGNSFFQLKKDLSANSTSRDVVTMLERHLSNKQVQHLSEQTHNEKFQIN